MFFFHFLQFEEWLEEKMVVATDESYRDAKNIASRYNRHQTFEREIEANKDRLQHVMQVSCFSACSSLLAYWRARVLPKSDRHLAVAKMAHVRDLCSCIEKNVQMTPLCW